MMLSDIIDALKPMTGLGGAGKEMHVRACMQWDKGEQGKDNNKIVMHACIADAWDWHAETNICTAHQKVCQLALCMVIFVVATRKCVNYLKV